MPLENSLAYPTLFQQVRILDANSTDKFADILVQFLPEEEFY